MMNLARISARMQTLKDWTLEVDNITKFYEFKDFKDSIYFINKVAEIAEKLQHHPSIIINYNRVTLTLTTREEKGLSDKDFDVAEEIDKIEM